MSTSQSNVLAVAGRMDHHAVLPPQTGQTSNSKRLPCTRRKTEFSLRFRIRSEQKNDEKPRPLQIRLRVNGEHISDYGSTVYIRPQQWDQHAQLVKGRSQLVGLANERLAEIQVQYREILRELKRRHAKGEGKRPTAHMVKAEALKPGSTSPRLNRWYIDYLCYMDSLHGTEDALAEKTMQRAYKVLDYLREFVAPTAEDQQAKFSRRINIKGLADIDNRSPFLFDLNTGWAKKFHAFLQINPITGKRRMQKDSANHLLTHVRKAIDHAIDEGFLTFNPLDKFRPKRGKGKEVYFMEPEHIERLLALHYDGQMGAVIWWTKLMCVTGLDYVDAIRYAQNRSAFQKPNSAGMKLVIERSKPPCNTCEVPLLGEIGKQIESLFAEYPNGPIAPVLADVNRHLKVIQPLIGFDKKLTSKILRKTAGGIFLREGYAISTVSKALGHSSIRTTEQHYVKVTSSATDYDMERVARQKETGIVSLRSNVDHTPFKSIEKAS